jgi:hypothetical protein
MSTNEDLKLMLREKITQNIARQAELENEEVNLEEAIWDIKELLKFPMPRGRIWTQQEEVDMMTRQADYERQLEEIRDELQYKHKEKQALKESLLMAINTGNKTSTIDSVTRFIQNPELLAHIAPLTTKKCLTTKKEGGKYYKSKKNKKIRKVKKIRTMHKNRRHKLIKF